ncbi:MAG TPA: tetratricopeptide repeat protein [Caulobacteraceae bacterium]|jgi:tetratricopeptide (TPR) repeat protein|nr:tetratricopeptide repeat protein [Caulobacteraceae bacterium]
MPLPAPRPRLFLTALTPIGLAALLCACATATPAEKAGLRPRVAAVGEPAAKIQLEPRARGEGSLYGLFLAGEAALDRGSSADAARLLGRASEIGGDPYLKERAFTAAVIAGDIGRAAAVPIGDGQGSVASERLARLVRAVEALATNHGNQALALLKAQPPEGQTAQAATLLTPWAAAAAGDWTTALAPVPAVAGAPQLTSLYATFGRARLLERAGRLPEAEAAFKGLAVNPDNVPFVIGYGGFLERRGRRPEAIALYDRTLAKSADVEVVQARARAKAGRSAPAMLSVQEGAGEALLPPAATLIARRQPEMGLALMRLALRLDPKLDDAWLAVGDAMAAAGDVDASRQALSQISPSSPKYGAALNRLAWSMQRAGASDAALKLAKESLDRNRTSPDALSLYADLLRENGRFEESIELMDQLIAAPGARDGLEPWRLYYLRGVSWERTGRWDKAEPDLQQALKLNPAEPEIMNYLGFGWANRSQHLDQALELLQKAAALRPASGEIRDSLGWAKYRLGRFPDAVRDLERAAQLAPAEPDINDHLGDAYWRVGRKLEAEFQWSRVLSLAPDDRLRAQAEAKLRSGLEAAAPPPGPVAAAASPNAPGAGAARP